MDLWSGNAGRAAAIGLAAALAMMTARAGADDVGIAGRWLAEDIGGGGVIDDLQTVLEMRDDGAVSGSGGCNRFSGRAELAGTTLRFAPLASTRMMCPPATMDQEAKFFAALEKVAGFAVDQATRKLTLADADGRPLAVLARME